MSHKNLAVAFSLILIPSPVFAQADSARAEAAPVAGPQARYCMRIEPVTGSRVELVRCWTRQQWADQGVDVDKDWAKEGVSVEE